MNQSARSRYVPDPDFISDWNHYFLEIAVTASRKSKDPRCRVGAVIASADHLLISTGFNGLARRVFDDERILADVDEKLRWICHAEMNAIFNAARKGSAVEGATMFVTKFPCMWCCNAIVQAGIERLCTHDNKFWDDDPVDGEHWRKKLLLRQSGIEVVAPFHLAYSPSIRVMTRRPVPANNTSVKQLAQTIAHQKARAPKRARPVRPAADSGPLFQKR